MSQRMKALGLALLLQIPAQGMAEGFVAGLQPDRRPASAPTAAATPVDESLKVQRLQGIDKPWPGNLETIAAQGNWYSPMFRPGMPGPYDLRGLHVR